MALYLGTDFVDNNLLLIFYEGDNPKCFCIEYFHTMCSPHNDSCSFGLLRIRVHEEPFDLYVADDAPSAAEARVARRFDRIVEQGHHVVNESARDYIKSLVQVRVIFSGASLHDGYTLKAIQQLNDEIESIEWDFPNGTRIRFADVCGEFCANVNGEVSFDNFLFLIVAVFQALQLLRISNRSTSLPYPLHPSGVYLGQFIGDVVYTPTQSAIVHYGFLMLTYGIDARWNLDMKTIFETAIRQKLNVFIEWHDLQVEVYSSRERMSAMLRLHSYCRSVCSLLNFVLI